MSTSAGDLGSAMDRSYASRRRGSTALRRPALKMGNAVTGRAGQPARSAFAATWHTERYCASMGLHVSHRPSHHERLKSTPVIDAIGAVVAVASIVIGGYAG